MLLLEIALQGIRGFQPLARIALRPGMNVGRSADLQQRRAIVDSIYHLIFADPSRNQATAKLADPAAKESRIALTFFGRDQATYRIVREAATGAVSLHKFDTKSNKYAALTRTSQEVAQFVRVQQQIPDDVGYERLFIFAPETMPSQGPRAKTRSGQPIAAGLGEPFAPSGPGMPMSRSPSMMQRAGSRAGSGVHSAPPGIRAPSGITSSQSVTGSMTPMPGGFGSSMNMTNALVQSEMSGDLARGGSGDLAAAEPPDDAGTLEEKRVQLEKLIEQRDTVARAEHAQAELDQLNARKFELAEKVEGLRELENEIKRLEQQTEGQKDLLNLPKGFGERLRHLEEVQSKYQSDRQKLSDEHTDAEQQLQNLVVVDLQQDKYFLAGVALAVLFIAIAVFLEKPAIALLNVLCLTVAAGAAFRWVGDLERQARSRMKLNAIIEREQRLDKQYDLDTTAMKRLMESLEVSNPHELLERIEGAAQTQKHLEHARDDLDARLRDPAIGQAERELRELTSRIERCEAEVMGSTGGASLSALDRRIAHLEREVVELEAQLAVRSGRRAPPPARQPSGIAGAPRGIGAAIPVADAFMQTPSQVLRSSQVRAPVEPEEAAVMRSPSQILRAGPLRGTGDIDPQSVLRTPSQILRGVPQPGSGGTGDIDPQSVLRSPSQILRGVPQPGGRPPSVVQAPAAPPRAQSTVRPPVAPSKEAASLFDFGGGTIGSDDEEDGYGSGYGSGRGGSGDQGGGGSKTSSYDGEEVIDLYAIGGYGGGGIGGGGGGYDEGEGFYADRSRDLMQCALDLLAIPVDDLAGQIKPRLSQYLEAFTDGAFRTAVFGARGEMSVFVQEGGDAIPYMSLPAEQIDLVDTALRFSLIETCVTRFKIPVVFDDPFESFDPKKRMLLSQMLGYLGQATQIVVLSDKQDVSGHALAF